MAISVLLIGLGGTGSKIVNEVKKRLPENMENVCCIGFDTNIQDISEIDAIDIVRTSTNEKIGRYLARTENWNDWFPDNPLLHERSLSDGAGQIRCTSRLAFKSAVEGGFTGKIRRAIETLKNENGGDGGQNLKVMIVSSLVGGTGSGIFLEIPNYIRRLFIGNGQEETHLMIRGLFLLPDIFCDVVPGDTQKNTIYANAYAALRELNAMNQICTDRNSTIEMNLENFNSNEARGNASCMPYNLTFFLDRENLRGNILESFDNYIQQAIDITYMQLFSPITSTQFSSEDNRFINLIESNGKSLYGSAGSAKIIYPYADILDYAANRMAADSIEQTWDHFEKLYQQLNKRYLKMKKTDPSLIEPDRTKEFIKDIEKELNATKTAFPFLKNDLEISNDNETLPVVENYFQKINAFLVELNQKDEQIRTQEQKIAANEEVLMDIDSARDEIIRVESALSEYNTVIIKNERNKIVKSVQAIITEELEDVGNYEGGDYNLNAVVSSTSKPLHPISTRYVLSKLKAILEDECAVLEGSVAKLSERIRKYEEAYDTDDTDQKYETALSRIEECSTMFLSRINPKINPNYRRFIEEYLEKSAEQGNAIKKRSNDNLRLKVFLEIKERLSYLIGSYERFFINMDNTKDDLKARIETLAIKNKDTSTTTYILGDPADKEQIYLQIRANLSGEQHLNKSIFNDLYTGFYETAMVDYKNRDNHFRKQREDEEVFRSNMTEIFSNTVVKECRKMIAEKAGEIIDLDIIRALKLSREGLIGENRSDISEMLKTALLSTLNRACPLIYRTDRNGLEDYRCTYWGIHPEMAKSIRDLQPGVNLVQFFNVDANETNPEISQNERFSKYEIFCYNAHYGLHITDIPKFNEKVGPFYKRYRRQVEQINSVTPHLDKRWDNILPLIDEMEEHQRRNSLKKACVYGLGFADFKIVKNGDERVFRNYFWSPMGNPMTVNNLPIKENEFYLLVKMIENDPSFGNAVLEKSYKRIEKEKKSIDQLNVFDSILNQSLVKGLINKENTGFNILDVLLNYSKASDTDDFQRFEEAVISIIQDYCKGALINCENREEKEETLIKLIRNECYYASKEKEKFEDDSLQGIYAASWLS